MQYALILASLLQVSVAFTTPLRSGLTAFAFGSGHGRVSLSSLQARRKGDLFEQMAELDEEKDDTKSTDFVDEFEKPAGVLSPDKSKAMLAPEETFYEGPPSAAEVVIPAISILTVIGIIPFIATVTRQFWVNYKITSRRISVTSGFNGQDLTEVTYDEIYTMKFVYRNWGKDGDLVIELRDGAKLEMRSVPDFDNIYNYILNKCDSEVQEYSDKSRVGNGL